MRKLILEQIAKTESRIEEYKEMAAPVKPENAIGRVSRMDAINNKAVAEAALRNARVKLKNLEYALQQVDKPEFGKCKMCGTEIHPKRLILMPQSPNCVKCTI